MPDRLIRDELLRSHRYRTLPTDTARLLFIHLLLSVDNLGNIEGNPTSISDVLRRPVDNSEANDLICQLSCADLVRTYEIDGKPYLHIPRFRQRLRYLGAKHPRPPPEIECKEIRLLIEKVGLSPGFIPAKAGLSPLEVKRSEVKRSDIKALPPPSDDSDPQVKTTLIKVVDQTKPMTREEQIAFVAAKTKD